MDEDYLQAMFKRGQERIAVNFAGFRQLLAQAQLHAARREFGMAAAYGTLTAYQAANAHGGIFASADLERFLWELGARTISARASRSSRSASSGHERVLHVATEVQAVGGLSRMMSRWIGQDAQRRHSLALTRQSIRPIPDYILQSIRQSDGSIYLLDGVVGGIFRRAKHLRNIASSYDYVVLHIWPGDITAFLAFAANEGIPPVIYLNHADHHFWLGVSISNVIANMRASGARLSAQRRGVEASRNMILPTVLTPVHGSLSRAEAKHRLGIDQDQLVLLSVARGAKYRPLNGVSFPDTHLPLLAKHNAILTIVGIGKKESSIKSHSISGGKIHCIKETDQVGLFYQAADIYVDSFPFVSITSLLEAGQHGVPLVSRFPYSDASSILGADMPGLSETLIVARTELEYLDRLSWLISDDDARADLGQRTRSNIERHHVGQNWLPALETIYRCAKERSRPVSIGNWTDEPLAGEPDVFIEEVFGTTFDRWATLEYELGVLPFGSRVRLWRQLQAVGRNATEGRYGPLVQLLPEWLLCQVGRSRRSLCRVAS